MKRESLLLLMLILAGCSSVQEDYDDTFLDDFNRFGWMVNYEYFDPYVIRPASIIYMEYTPKPVRSMLSNFVNNLDEPSNMVNNLLMGNFSDAKNNFDRFLINSTVGLFGLIDLASHNELPESVSRDFGDVLGYYGVGHGPYVMIPFYGPWTLRGFADQVDSLYAPMSSLDWWQRTGKWGVQGMETRYNLLPQESMLNNSPDPYALSRQIYLEYRDYKAEVEPEPEELIDEDLLDQYME